jgi:hypothetical protein
MQGDIATWFNTGMNGFNWEVAASVLLQKNSQETAQVAFVPSDRTGRQTSHACILRF